MAPLILTLGSQGTSYGTHFMEGWVVPRAGPYVEKKGKIWPLSGVEARYIVQSVVRPQYAVLFRDSCLPPPTSVRTRTAS
jgi:hypothetical protein